MWYREWGEVGGLQVDVRRYGVRKRSLVSLGKSEKQYDHQEDWPC